MKHLHLPLNELLHAELMRAAQSSGQSATQLARQALEVYLAQHKADALNAKLDAYIQRHAGTSLDLDSELEASGVEHLLHSEQA